MGPISRERRRHVERMVGGGDAPLLSYEAKLMDALADTDTIGTAKNILTKCGCPPLQGVLS